MASSNRLPSLPALSAFPARSRHQSGLRARCGALAGLLAGLSLLAFGALPARTGTLEAGKVKETVFPSGLRLVVKESHTSDLAAVQLWIRAGGFTEDEASAGTAHVIEHLLFKSGEPGGTGSVDAEVENLGGLLEASTEKDWTRLGCTVAGRYAGKVIGTIANTVTKPQFRPQDFASEKPLILEEINQIGFDPEALVTRELYRLAFQKHPYRNDVRGTPRFVNQLDLQEVRAYYQKHYIPANMVLVVVGDVDPAGIERVTRTAFAADQPAKAQPAPLPADEMAGEKEERRVVPSPLRAGLVGLAYPAPSVKDPEVYAMDVLLTLLEHGGTGRLPRLLKDTAGVQATYETRRQAGLFTIIAITPGRNVDDLEALIRKELDFLVSRPVPEAELRYAKNALRGTYALDNEAFAGQAATLGYYAAIDRWQFASDYLAKVEAVTAEQLQAVAKKYLDQRRSVALVLQPRPAEPQRPQSGT